MRFELTPGNVAIALAIFVVTTLISAAVACGYIVTLREDYFTGPRSVRTPGPRSVVGAIGRHALDLFMVAMGLVLAIPGVPGQGALTILVGLLLMDIPGKRRIVRWLFELPGVLKAVNRLRDRFERPPLELE